MFLPVQAFLVGILHHAEAFSLPENGQAA